MHGLYVDKILKKKLPPYYLCNLNTFQLVYYLSIHPSILRLQLQTYGLKYSASHFYRFFVCSVNESHKHLDWNLCFLIWKLSYSWCQVPGSKHSDPWI